MQKEIKNKYKVAMVAPVPFYYQIPLFCELAKSSKIDFKVFYCSDEPLRGEDVKRMYRTENKFSDENDLLKGYNFTFLKNYSPSPSFLRWPFGLMNFGIWNEIKKGKYNVVILQAWNNFTWLVAFFACLKFKTPIVFMTDANVLQETQKKGIKKFFKNIFLRDFIFKKAKGFLTTGLSNENFYKTYGAKKEKMAEIRYHYGYENFLKNSEKLRPLRQQTRESFGVMPDDFVLLYVGRLAEDKDIFTLLDAYKKVDFKNKKLFFVGDGPMRNKIQERIKKLGIEGVKIFGFQSREEIVNFYNLSDALVLPSTNEPWGMVVNEALCFGLPVIVSDKVGAGADLVKNNWNGFVFEAGNSDKLEACIKKVVGMKLKEREIFGSRSVEIIKKWINIDSEKQILKIMEII